ncbi:complement C1q tumor necrosis factor-related protein 3-like [Mercenaria mercenaria]|uniref:complement C1q tumor necrosis factor-related protein 3-like n=1 Tax=Mercenaria mercenaria TaxID=6596 RepID=UPI00234F6D33|nr:complement C1q tumor necrosis factor-related protein 3-like [Mercenaria mercenaria]
MTESVQSGSIFCFVCIVICSVAAASSAAEDKIGAEYILREIQNLKTKVSELENDVIRLQRRNDDLEQEVSTLQHEQEYTKENGAVQSYGNKAANQTYYEKYPRSVASSCQIAFTVGVSVVDLTNLGDHHTVIFDRAISNIGNAYSTTSGIFQVPLKGAYVFTLTMMVLSRHSEYLEIVVDGNRINDILADASSVDDFMSTTKQWILDLNSGSEVWIRTSSYQNHGEIHGTMHTLFSGFLLFETE